MRESANDHLLKEIYSAQQTNKHGLANRTRAGYRDVGLQILQHNEGAAHENYILD
jgi:hypothetical protein